MKKLNLTEKDLRQLVKEYILKELNKKCINNNTWLPRMETLVREGLIMSYNPNEVISILKRLPTLDGIGSSVSVGKMLRWAKYHTAYKQTNVNSANRTTQDKNGLVTITITIDGWLNKNGYNAYRDIENCLNRCGYFLSCLIINGENTINNITKNIWNKCCSLGKNFFVFRFEPKYDVNVHIDNIPNYCYHIAPKKYLPKILKNGLQPKSGNKIAAHPERVYLFMWKPENWHYIAEMFSTTYDNNDFVLLMVNTYSLRNNIKFYFDQNTFKSYPDAIYTLEPIPPQAIKVIDEYSISKKMDAEK